MQLLWSTLIVLSALDRPSRLASAEPSTLTARADGEGNWTKLTCDDIWYREWLDLSASERWRELDAEGAWEHGLAQWKTDQKRNDTSFTGSVMLSFNEYAGIDCGVMDNCFHPVPCKDGNGTGPAASIISNSFTRIHDFFTYFLDSSVQPLPITLSRGDMGAYNGGKELKTPDESEWKPVFNDLIKLGTATILGGGFRYYLLSSNYFTEPDAVKPEEVARHMANTSMAAAQDWIDGKWTGDAKVSGKEYFLDTMDQAIAVWDDILRKGLRALFDGTNPHIDLVHNIITDGKLIAGANVSDHAGENNRDIDFVSKRYTDTIFAVTLEATWRHAGAAPFILDSGYNCGDNNTDGLHLKSKVKDFGGACVGDKQYYLVSGKSKSFSLLPGVPTKESFRMDGWEYGRSGFYVEDIINGAVATYLANGQANTNERGDLTNATVVESLITNGVRGAGLFNIPVCSAEVAHNAKGSKSAPGYPCNKSNSAGGAARPGGAIVASILAMATMLYIS